jgi:phospholipid/cholesterol/gamma-HCH transport system permease protein
LNKAISSFNLSFGLGRWGQRLLAAILLGGQVMFHLLQGKINRRNTLEQMLVVGPASLIIVLVTSASTGAIFTIQVAREFIHFGATNAIGGVLAIALVRELAPALSALVIAGRVCSAFAAEIGTMQVTEQIDALQMLRANPVDYLVTPRVLACCLMLPVLTVMGFLVGMGSGLMLASVEYGISHVVFITSVRNFLEIWDVICALIKALVFGGLISVIGCSWGLTTTGGAKGVGQSTTTAVVTATLAVFISDFLMSWLMFQGVGDASL